MLRYLKYYTKDLIKLALQYLNLILSSKHPVLVLTMAKVGSLSIYESVKKASDIPCFHIHSLDLQELARSNKMVFDAGLVPDSRSPIKMINDRIINVDRPYKVISLFRNPVERNISAFFDAFHLLVGVPPHQFRGNVEELVNIYHEKLLHQYPILWYEEHFSPGIGVDVYEYPFDPNRGYLYLETQNCNALLMNSALDNMLKEQLVRDFLNIDSFQLINVNVTDDSKVSGLYKAFKSTIKFEKAYLDSLIDTRYAKHFFSVDQLNEIRQRWQVSVTT